MKYQISQLKLEQLVSYFKDEVIDLTPAFQRGRVWNLKTRKGLLRNILQGKPVPAVFLYKKPEGSKNSYIILDGKQRLESILLYIGAQREDLTIPGWTSYFFRKEDKAIAHFKTDVNGTQKSLKELDNEEMLRFRDYVLSIIEIDFDENSTLDQMIQLFVDINQFGVKVNRFDIVKALSLKDAPLQQIFKLIALKEQRRNDANYKIKKTAYSRVLGKLDIVKRLEENTSRVDVMWEKLFELALYSDSGQHRKPVQILKDFIKKKNTTKRKKLATKDVKRLASVFARLDKEYSETDLGKTRWATDQTHFYIMATAMLERAKDYKVFQESIAEKLIKFDAYLGGKSTTGLPAKTVKHIAEYISLSAKQTTDIGKRQKRAQLFSEIIREV